MYVRTQKKTLFASLARIYFTNYSNNKWPINFKVNSIQVNKLEYWNTCMTRLDKLFYDLNKPFQLQYLQLFDPMHMNIDTLTHTLKTTECTTQSYIGEYIPRARSILPRMALLGIAFPASYSLIIWGFSAIFYNNNKKQNIACEVIKGCNQYKLTFTASGSQKSQKCLYRCLTPI